MKILQTVRTNNLEQCEESSNQSRKPQTNSSLRQRHPKGTAPITTKKKATK